MVKLDNQNKPHFDTFYSIEPEKRQRIIDVAMAEFADKGFKNASTNKIAAHAHIGKGMLFYYFRSKEELYDFICEYMIEYIKREFLSQFLGETGDFIERQRLMATVKRQAMIKEPPVFALFESIYRPANAEYAGKYIAELAQCREEFMRRLYGGVDYSLFREDVAPERAIRYIEWLLGGYTAEAERRLLAGELAVELDDMSEWEQYDIFIDDIKRLFYQ